MPVLQSPLMDVPAGDLAGFLPLMNRALPARVRPDPRSRLGRWHPLQFADLALELADFLGGLRAHSRRLALIDGGLADPLTQRLRGHPQRRATAVIAAYSDG